MRYVKRLPLSHRDPISNRFAVDQNNLIITNSTNAMQLPSGTLAQRPATPINGEIRYNTQLGTSGELEAFVDGTWQIIKTNRQQTITQNTFTGSNYSNTIFGPLTYNVDITKPQNVMVYIENVYQIPTTNYVLHSSTSGNLLSTSTQIAISTSTGATTLYLNSTADFDTGNSITVDTNTGTILSVTTNSITINTPLSVGISSGDTITTKFSTGTFVQFTPGDIPAPNKPITVLLGFDGYTPPFEV